MRRRCAIAGSLTPWEHEIVVIHTKIFGFVLPDSGHVKIALNARRAAVRSGEKLSQRRKPFGFIREIR
jgi:hypothetical protein